VVIDKQQTFRHKIKIFRKNGKSCDIVSTKISQMFSTMLTLRTSAMRVSEIMTMSSTSLFARLELKELNRAVVTPADLDDTQIGIVSYGITYCLSGYPSAFTRVTGFLDWIGENTDVKIQ
jgi:hypothetical protein